MAVFAIAFSIRLIHLNSYVSYPGFDLPLAGNAAYVKTALKIVDGDILGGRDIFYDNSPIYSYILAAAFKIFGIDFYAVRFVQIIIGSLSCCLIFWICRYYFGVTAALISGAIASFYGPLIFYDAEVIVLPWVLLFCLVSIVIIIRDGTRSVLAMGLAGLFIGMAVMGRPNLILFPVLLLPVLVFGREKRTVLMQLRVLAAFYMGMCIIPGIFTARDHAVSGEIVFLNPTGGHNFYFGHHKGASPVFDERLKFTGSIFLKYKEIAEAEVGKTLSASDVSSYWYKKGLEYIIQNPIEEMKLILNKTRLFFNNTEVPTYFNYYFNRNYSTVLKHWVLPFGLVLPVSVLGFIMSLRKCRELMVLYVFFSASFLSALMFFVISRLRIPAVPVLIIFAGAGGAVIIKWCKETALKPLVLSGILMATLYWTTFTTQVELGYAEPYNHLGAAYWYKGNIPEAERSFLKALELEPDFEYPLLNLMKMFRMQGDIEKEAEYRGRYEDWKRLYKSVNGENSVGETTGAVTP